jgi:diguanylate cyclase (GGDEF)-like protein/PAS domain S-box-containing protein
LQDLKKRLEEMQECLRLSSTDVRDRQSLLGLDADSLTCLTAHAELIDGLHVGLVDAWYEHLLTFPDPARLLGDEGKLRRVSDMQLRYYRQMVSGPYDMQYARLRLLVGLSHESLGVEQKWSTAAYHFYLDYMHRSLQRVLPDQPEQVDSLFRALMRVVFFDMTLTVDTYFTAKRLELEHTRGRYARALLGSNDGIWEWEVDADRLEVSPRWLAILGLDADSAPTTMTQWIERMPIEQRSGFKAAFNAHLQGYRPQMSIECQVRNALGQPIWVLVRGVLSANSAGDRVLAGSLSDINLRKTAEQELAHVTLHDPLTGLPNRQSVNRLILQALQRQSKPGARHAAVLFIDVDRFKLINDSLGHQIGDKVLIEVGARIQRCLRPGDHLCRFGGDEFVVLLDDLAQADDAQSVARRIMEGLMHPMIVAGHRLSVTASIGIAPLHGSNEAQDALREADLALYRAKAFGKSQMALYNDDLQIAVNQQLRLENALSEALEKRQFELYYQPIVQVEEGNARVIGVEALLRWWQDGSLISPDAFIPILEETGRIVEVGDWVLRQACLQVLAWHEQGFAGLRCSVNLSSRQLHNTDFARSVASVLEDTGFPPGSLVLEITESLLMQDGPETLATLRELESLGIRIALDDFGTGFSSLGYLHRYPLHIIKVDKSFITKAPDDERLRAISRAIIGLGRGLSMDVIAEGIETSAQMDFLRDEGCRYVQGYWFSRPLSASSLSPVLESLSGRCITDGAGRPVMLS